MASQRFKERPGGNIVRWKKSEGEDYRWYVPKGYRKTYIQKHRQHVNQLLQEGRYEEAELAGDYHHRMPYYW